MDFSRPQSYQSCVRFLSALMGLLEHRIPHMRGRMERIERACGIIGSALGLTRLEFTMLLLAGRYHDVGMLAIPDSIVCKPGALTEEELVQFRAHTDLGGRFIGKLFPEIPALAEIVWWHHERPDGRGPYGLKGDEIPLPASIINVVQAMESMVNERPHRTPLTLQQAIAELERNRDKQFDERVVDVVRIHAEAVYRALRAPHRSVTRLTTTGSATGSTAACAVAAGTQRADNSSPRTPAKPNAPSFSRRMENLKPLITKDELLQLIADGLEIRPLAASVQAIIHVTSNSQCTTDQVADAIVADQALAIRILKLASSSTYSRGRPVENVRDAVQRIGISEVRNLALTLSVLSNYQGRIAEYVNPWLFWEHSIAVGVIATMIGRACRTPNHECGFLWGVLHDVGRLVLIDHQPDRYAEVWSVAEAMNQRLEVIEKHLLMLNHCEILERALEHWRFPHKLIAPVVNHHQTPANIKRLGPGHSLSAATIGLSDRIAHAMLLGCSGNDAIYPIEELADLVGVDDATLRAVIQDAPNETHALKVSMLARGDLEPWPEFAHGVKARFERPVRPLCVSMRPELDAYRIFFDRIADASTDDSPNLGVIYTPDFREIDGLIQRYEALEQKDSGRPLPILLIKGKGKINADHAWLKSRRIEVIEAPASIRTISDAVNRLLLD